MTKPKPWLSTDEQIAQLKEKGVSFELFGEDRAKEYLTNCNTYFRIRSYRKNFNKHDDGPNAGRYVNLGFEMLVTLAGIDTRLRDEMLNLTLDIEHFSKVELLRRIESRKEDGYVIVVDFMEQQRRMGRPVESDFAQGINSDYIGSLIKARPDHDYPVWEFVEIVPFGRFVHFLSFCAYRFDDKSLKDSFYMLKCVKGLRNACAHNSCILNDVKSSSAKGRPNNALTVALGGIQIGRESRRTKLSNERLKQIATTLYMHQAICSENTKAYRAEGLKAFANLIRSKESLYDQSCPARSALDFIASMIDGWYGDNVLE